MLKNSLECLLYLYIYKYKYKPHVLIFTACIAFEQMQYTIFVFNGLYIYNLNI